MSTPLKTRCAGFCSLALVLVIALTGCSRPERPTIGLYPAIERGDLDQIRRHIHWGTDINAPNIDGETPLQAAGEVGQIVIVRMLLDSGARIDATDRGGHTALYRALMAGRTQVADLLVQRGAQIDPTALLHAVVEQNVADRDVIAFLIKQGANLEGKNASGDTPLLAATKRGERVLAKLLIAKGADVNARDAEGKTPLARALQSGNAELQRLLHENGGLAQ